MKRILLVITILMFFSVTANAEEVEHTRWYEVGDYDTEEQIAEEIREGEMEMLAQLIEAEAGNQDYRGKCLVADVVLNRVASNDYPDTIEGVVFEKHKRKNGKTVYQFTSIMDGNFDRAGWDISEDSFKAAMQEYTAEIRIDESLKTFTAGYYNPYSIPAYQHGDHYFGY